MPSFPINVVRSQAKAAYPIDALRSQAKAAYPELSKYIDSAANNPVDEAQYASYKREMARTNSNGGAGVSGYIKSKEDSLGITAFNEQQYKNYNAASLNRYNAYNQLKNVDIQNELDSRSWQVPQGQERAYQEQMSSPNAQEQFSKYVEGRIQKIYAQNPLPEIKRRSYDPLTRTITETTPTDTTYLYKTYTMPTKNDRLLEAAEKAGTKTLINTNYGGVDHRWDKYSGINVAAGGPFYHKRSTFYKPSGVTTVTYYRGNVIISPEDYKKESGQQYNKTMQEIEKYSSDPSKIYRKPGYRTQKKTSKRPYRSTSTVVPVRTSFFGNPSMNAIAFGDSEFGSSFDFLSTGRSLQPISTMRKQRKTAKKQRPIRRSKTRR